MAIGTTRSKRRLGRYMAPIIKRSGLTVDDITKLVRCAPQSVYRMQAGDALPRLPLLLAVLDVVKASTEERVRATELWDIADADNKVHIHEDLSDAYRRFRMDEVDAVREWTLDRALIPGPLQTDDYAAAVWTASPLVKYDRPAEHAILDRTRRRELLLRNENPLELDALIDEAALRRVIGGRTIMVAQLDHLVRMAELPNVTIQALPLDYQGPGPYVGVLLLKYPEPNEPDSAHLESLAGIVAKDDAVSVALYSEIWEAVAAAAPSPKKSMRIIEAVRSELGWPTTR